MRTRPAGGCRLIDVLWLSVLFLFLFLFLLAGCRSTPNATLETEQPLPANPTETLTIFQSPVETPAVFQSPVETPRSMGAATEGTCPSGCMDPSEQCLIKGIVTGMGDKYYYLPDMPGYKDARVLIMYGGRWFCTEEEAIQNGWQRAPQ